MHAGTDWPEQAVYRGPRRGRGDNIEQWASVWESSQIEIERLEELRRQAWSASGAWRTRGAASGVDGTMPFVILLDVQGWEDRTSLSGSHDHDAAVAAARGA